MTKPVPPAPPAQKPKAPVRLPQRSEEISGDELHQVPAPIAAANKNKNKPN